MAALSLGVASCGHASPSALDPHGPGSARIAGLWWFMFSVSAAVVVFVGAVILVGILPRRRRRHLDTDATPTWAKNLVVGGGVVFPVVVLSVLWVLTLHDMQALSSPPGRARLEVIVEGYQWWWKVQYPQLGIVTANDIHIPTGQPVRIRLVTHDVIHSFWVPQLTGKTDLISGKVNSTWVETDTPGVYRGQCAEYCGLQHANMIFYVVAQTRPDFDAWAARERQGASPPATSDLLRGQDVFLSSPCESCHTVRGTPAHGTLGPDLTHFGSRLTIGAGAAPNNPGTLGGWIIDSQGVKPGNRMPPIQLPAQDLQALIDWLESLK